MKKTVKYLLNKLGWELSRVDRDIKLHQFLYESKNKSKNSDAESFFLTDQKEKIFLDFHYRYKVKKCWKAFPILINFYHLISCNSVSEIERSKFFDFIGNNTITCPLNAIHNYVEPILRQNKNYFEGTRRSLSRYWVPKLPDEYLIKNLKKMKKFLENDLKMIDRLNNSKKITTVLDVGCGRGFSTAAFAELGFNVTGIDSNYEEEKIDNTYKQEQDRVKNIFKGNYKIFLDDIRNSDLPRNKTFDLIYSISCLEHINNLGKAIKEMFRLLKPGGFIMHHLNPFWSENGGHALGTLDAPWLHAILNKTEFERYLKEFRLFESDLAISWTRKYLNRNITINSLQRLITDNGFNLLHWSEVIKNRENIAFLNQQTLLRIQKTHSDVSLADLLASNITFVAQKPFNRNNYTLTQTS